MARRLVLLRFALASSTRTNTRLLSCNQRAGNRFVTGTYSEVSDMRQRKYYSSPRILNVSRPGAHLASSFYSTHAETAEELLHNIISNTENVEGSVYKHEFQAETKKLLDIVARSLYSEKELYF
ncbi:hypothetical protein NFI96_019822 [Prochilodus magdalenae]|nr:hypothetical protein NFI96_019822 [Prochilodus magdalenae]